MGHATGQAVKRNGNPCTVLTRLYSVQDIRHVTWTSVELGTIIVFCACRNFVQEIRVKAVLVMGSIFFCSYFPDYVHSVRFFGTE